MATLILSTVGTALGGPVGAAIGALIGQSFDQQILGPATRGPRLGDLSVQTSSYGTQMPRIYGRMRVAGSVIWSTDLTESTQTTGAKGQPDTTYSYAVSFAVALSSRPIVGIGRIWADGKLIRGPDGVFTATTTFRFYDGSESQDADPLIASIEGIGLTPAYRGLALAVFETLELADFGNRIPFLTFEVLGDDSDPEVGAILADAARGAIAASSNETIIGYAAYGLSIKAAAAPLVETFALELFDDGNVFRAPLGAAPEIISEVDLGNSADSDRASRIQREQSPVRAVPGALRLAFYDPDRDYQSGEARASAGEQGGAERSSELPAVVGAARAKAIVNQALARQWARRDKVTLRLPPRFLALQPGERLRVPLSPSEWTVESCTIEGFVAAVELRPSAAPAVTLAAESGRIMANSSGAQAAMTVALFDAPELYDQKATSPTLLLAASSPAGKWKRRTVTIDVGGESFVIQTSARKSLLGRALELLPPGDPFLIDTARTFEVALVDADQWLTSCDDEALAAGANLAMLGSELLQFGDALPTAPGRFRLGRLVRGRGGTEWAMAGHGQDEPFALAGADALLAVKLPQWTSGATATVTPSGASASKASLAVGAEGLRPPSPVNLSATLDGDGNLALAWTRRSRLGWAWRDEVEVPIGETSEAYSVRVAGGAGSVERNCVAPAAVLTPSEFASAGSGAATVEVRQIGDFAASHPASLTITLP